MNSTQQMYTSYCQNHQALSLDEESMLSGKNQSRKTVAPDSNFPLCQTVSPIKKNKKIRKGDFKLIQENCQNSRTVVSNRKQAHPIYIELDIEVGEHDQIAKAGKKDKKIGKRLIKRVKKQSKELDSVMQQEKHYWFNSFQFESTNIKSEKENIENVAFKGLKLVQNIAEGEVGYSTLMFKNKIIEGTYYLEFKVLESLMGLVYKNKPDIRVGVCGTDHKLDTPLGYGKSIGLSLNKKIVIEEGIKKRLSDQNFQEQIVPGNIIGMLLQFSPPFRSPNKQKVWEDSRLTFFLNGKILGRYKHVKQMFYHPALSLYNGSRLEIRTRAEQMQYLPEECLPFEKITQFVNNYK